MKPVLSSDVNMFSQSRRIACEAPEMPVSPMTRRTQKRFGCVARHGLKHMKRLTHKAVGA